VNVLSPVMSNVVEVDVFIKTEDNMCGDEKKKVSIERQLSFPVGDN